MFEVVESTVTVWEVNGRSFGSRAEAAAASAEAAAQAQIAAFATSRGLKPRAETRLRNELARWEGWKAAAAQV